MHKFLRTPALALALATALASTTGYCVIQRTGPDEPPLAPGSLPSVRLLPEAVIPYPLTGLE